VSLGICLSALLFFSVPFFCATNVKAEQELSPSANTLANDLPVADEYANPHITAEIEARSHLKIHGTTEHVIAMAFSAFLLVICAVLHYEALFGISWLFETNNMTHRVRIIAFMLLVFAVHVVEVWIFAFGYYLLSSISGYGYIDGKVVEGAFDYVYFSASTYSTLGYGDLVPVGPIRILVATEALSGLMFIAWTASFAFLKMHNLWQEPHERSEK